MKIFANRQKNLFDYVGQDIWIKCDIPESYHDPDIPYGDYATFVNIIDVWYNPVTRHKQAYYRAMSEAEILEPQTYDIDDEVYMNSVNILERLYTVHLPVDTLTSQEISELTGCSITPVAAILADMHG